MHAFIQSECEEAGLRQALNDAAPLYRDAPEATENRTAADSVYRHFIEEVLPDASAARQQLACELLTTTLSSVGSGFSSSPRTAEEISRFSDAMADMFSAWLRESAQKDAG